MKTLLEWLGFCKHKYTVYKEADISYTGEDNKKHIVSYMIILKCEHCGKLKSQQYYV